MENGSVQVIARGELPADVEEFLVWTAVGTATVPQLFPFGSETKVTVGAPGPGAGWLPFVVAPWGAIFYRVKNTVHWLVGSAANAAVCGEDYPGMRFEQKDQGKVTCQDCLEQLGRPEPKQGQDDAVVVMYEKRILALQEAVVARDKRNFELEKELRVLADSTKNRITELAEENRKLTAGEIARSDKRFREMEDREEALAKQLRDLGAKYQPLHSFVRDLAEQGISGADEFTVPLRARAQELIREVSK